MTVTIKDVAAEAGVSIATVSRVLANKAGFYSEATAARVREAADRLGYRKNTNAVELVTQKSQVIGVIVSSTKTNFSNQIIEGIQSVAFQHDLSVMILYAEDEGALQTRALRTLIGRSVMGILVLAVQLTDANLALLENSRIPHRFLSTSFKGDELAFTASDDYQIGYQATDYLIKKGHQRIGLVAMDVNSYIGQQRVAGYRDAMVAAKLAIDDDWIKPGLFTYQNGVTAMTEFGADPDVTAIIGTSDMAAIGVLNQAQNFGVKVPEQLAILSIDGTQLVKIVRPQLTSITQAFYEMGRRGMLHLLTPKTAPANEFIPFKLDERSST